MFQFIRYRLTLCGLIEQKNNKLYRRYSFSSSSEEPIEICSTVMFVDFGTLMLNTGVELRAMEWHPMNVVDGVAG